MTINTIPSSKIHQKLIIDEACLIDKLPFTNVLSQEILDKHLSGIGLRQRCYTPDLTLFAFTPDEWALVAQPESIKGQKTNYNDVYKRCGSLEGVKRQFVPKYTINPNDSKCC